MKILNLTILILIIIVLLGACSGDDDDTILGNWVERSVFDGTPRSSAVSFTINNKGYVGTGFDGDDYLKDFWVYDIEGNFWAQLSDFPGVARSSATGFAHNTKGYIGTGFDGDFELNDFYSYDTASNTWAQIANFPGTPRRGAIAFEVNDGAYVGTGFDGDNDKKDFFKYTPATDLWEEKPGFGGAKRQDAATFQIGETVYLGTGISNGRLETDFWAFDLATETWSSLLDLDDDDNGDDLLPRSNAVGFSMNGKGYFACGIAGGVSGSIWEYDPISDSWEEKTSFEGQVRQDPIAFENGSRAFIALGRFGTSLYFDDMAEFFPLQEEDEDD